MIKQIAITEDYIVVRFENNSIDVYNRYGKAKEALREIAKEHLFEYNPDWNTRQFGKKLIDAIGSEAKAIVNDNYVVYIDTKGSIICGRKSQENTKEKLRMIVNKYSIPYEESWNTQQLGRKVIKHLLSAKADSTVQDKKYFSQKTRKDIIEFLEKTSKLFYNERDLQMNLADFLKRQNYYDNVFLEYSLPAFSSSEEEELTLDLEADIIATTGEIPHHTITPIARVVDGQFEMDLVLRDNHTSELHPDGVYHPHKDVQHIKKENIGLIEVMGLAILPPRLKTELEEVEKYLLGKDNAIADYHLEWADQLKEKYSNVKEEEINSVVQHEVGQVFARVLEDAGVYKNTLFGHEAFMRFVKSVGIN